MERAVDSARNNGGFQVLELSQIKPNPRNARKRFDKNYITELAVSIKSHGLLNPVSVRPMPDGTFELIAGECRYRASKQAGLETIAARILDADDQTTLELNLIENLVRRDIDPIEEAQGYQQMCDILGYTQEQIGLKVNRDQATVANRLRLLGLPEDLRQLISQGEISPTAGRALAGWMEYPQIFELKKAQAIEGKPTKVLESLTVQDYQSLPNRDVGTPEGPWCKKHPECAECPKRRQVKDTFFNATCCLDFQCYTQKQEADQAKQEQELREKLKLQEGQTIPNVRDMGYNSYVNLSQSWNKRDGCRGKACENYQQAVSGDNIINICTKPGCHRALGAAKTRDHNKEARAQRKEKLERALAFIKAARTRDDISRIAAALVGPMIWPSFNADRTRKALEIAGVTLDLDRLADARPVSCCDELAKLGALEIVLFAGAWRILEEEANCASQNASYLQLAEWLAPVQPEPDPTPAPVDEKPEDAPEVVQPNIIERVKANHETREEAIARLEAQIQGLINAAGGTLTEYLKGQVSTLQAKIDRLKSGQAMPPPKAADDTLVEPAAPISILEVYSEALRLCETPNRGPMSARDHLERNGCNDREFHMLYCEYVNNNTSRDKCVAYLRNKVATLQAGNSEEPAQPAAEVLFPISGITRVGDLVCRRDVDWNEKESVASYDSRLLETRRRIHAITEDFVQFEHPEEPGQPGQLILKESLDMHYRFWLDKGTVDVGDEIAFVFSDSREPEIRTISKLNNTEIRFLDSASHPSYGTLNHKCYLVVSKARDKAAEGVSR